MCLIAEIEIVCAMPSAVRQRERPDRDRKRLERGWLAVPHGLSRQHGSDVCLYRHVRDDVAPAGFQHADTQ
jgi:hypothetical protein